MLDKDAKTMLPPSPGMPMGKLNLKPEFAKTWQVKLIIYMISSL